MHYRFVSISILILLCTYGCGRSVKIDENVSSIPKDTALEYLLNTSNTYTDDKCLYTQSGVVGIPYSNLEFEAFSNVWGNQYLVLWKKDEKRRFTVAGQENLAWVCTPIRAGGVGDGFDFTLEEVEGVFHKTASALKALGIEMVE